MRKAIVLATLTALASCAPPMTQEQQIQGIKLQMQLDDARCRSYGFTFGSAQYGNCRMTLDRERRTTNTQYGRPLFGQQTLGGYF